MSAYFPYDVTTVEWSSSPSAPTPEESAPAVPPLDDTPQTDQDPTRAETSPLNEVALTLDSDRLTLHIDGPIRLRLAFGQYVDLHLNIAAPAGAKAPTG